MTTTGKKAYSISISGVTYDRLKAVVAGKSLRKFVEGLILSGLDDPSFLSRVDAPLSARRMF